MRLLFSITALVFLIPIVTFSQQWKEGTIFKSQNPNKEIPKKLVNINGSQFEAFLCESYSDWQNGSYTQLESRFWYILPHDENAISAIRDTTIQFVSWGWSNDISYIPYLDGTIENGYHTYYKNGKIKDIQVSDKTWPFSNNTALFNGLDDHMFPVLNTSYKPEIKIECDEYGFCLKKIIYDPIDCAFSISKSSGMSKTDENKLLDDIMSKALVIKQDFIDLNQDFKFLVTLRTFGGESSTTYDEGQLRICFGGKFPLMYGGKTYYSWGFDMAPEEDGDHDAFQIIKDRKKQNYDDEKITFKTTRIRKGVKFENDDVLKFNVDYSTIDPWMFPIEINKVSNKLYFKLNNKVKNVVDFIPYRTNNIAVKAMNYSNDTQLMNLEIHQEISIEDYLDPLPSSQEIVENQNSTHANNIRVNVSESSHNDISKIAVFGQKSELCDGSKDDGQSLAAVVEGELLGFYGVVERKHLEQILDEQRLAMSGLLFEDSDFAQAGCLAGAQGTVLASYGCLQGKTKIQIKLVDCSTSDLYWSATGVDVSEFELLDALRVELSK